MKYRQHVFHFLDKLRASGKTNMLGASLYIQIEFALDPKTSNQLLVDWIKDTDRHEKN